VTQPSPPCPEVGPASDFLSIEKKYGPSIREWQAIVAGYSEQNHTAIVNHLIGCRRLDSYRRSVALSCGR